MDDLIDGVVRMMRSGVTMTGPVNLGNPGEFTMLELAERVLKLAQSRSRIRFAPLPADDPRQRRPDLTLAERELGWRPTVALEDGLKETIAYFRRLLNA